MCKLVIVNIFGALVLLANAVECKRSRSPRTTEIPKPRIEALSPRGLKVTLPDQEGMQLFSFHGKINSPIRRSEHGNIVEEALYPINGEWIIEDKNVQLRIGDVINYWIFVQVKSMGYRKDDLSMVVRELFPAHRTEDASSEPTLTTKTNNNCNCNFSELKSITSALNATLSQLKNLNNKIIPLSSQVESLTEILEDVIKDKNIGTQLLLTGQEPPGRNALEAIRQLITEKLELIDLEENILQAYRTKDGILFELSSPIDKQRVLFRAKQRLQNSSYKIHDPQRMFTHDSNLVESTSNIDPSMVRFGENRNPHDKDRESPQIQQDNLDRLWNETILTHPLPSSNSNCNNDERNAEKPEIQNSFQNFQTIKAGSLERRSPSMMHQQPDHDRPRSADAMLHAPTTTPEIDRNSPIQKIPRSHNYRYSRPEPVTQPTSSLQGLTDL